MTAPYLIQRQQVALKIEATEGTDSVPTSTDLIAPVFDVEWSVDVRMDERAVLQPSFSRIARVAGERSAQISFSTELKGSGAAGTAPAHLSAALKACGLGETVVPATSVTYAPASSAISSATVEIREGSKDTVFKQKKIVGARGTFTIEATKGDIVLVRFTFTGRYIEPADTVALTPMPAVTPNPLPFQGAALSFHGQANLKIQEFNLDIGNEVSLRNDANQASGNFSAVIVGRSPSGSINPEQEDTTVINFFQRMTANTEGILTWALTGSAGNIATFTANKVQIGPVSEGDRDGIRIEELDLFFNQDTVAGDNEFSLAFT